MRILFTGIKELVQVRPPGFTYAAGEEMNRLPVMRNAYLLIENGLIADFGSMDELGDIQADRIEDCTGRIVLPAWVDSHTHLVYAGNREGEFADKIRGMTYEEIAARGGGIINSVMKLRATSEEQLYREAARRLEHIMKMGTGTVEIKSGYGLDTESELKMLRVIRRLDETYPVTVKATFLGAHAVPPEFRGNVQSYTDYLITETLPAVAGEHLADFVDVFCEQGYFPPGETGKIISAAADFGLEAKIHVNQFHSIGGVQVSLRHRARSIDHLEVLTEEDLRDMQNNPATMPVALPGCSLFLSIPYTPARRIIDAGLPLALATDYNPGSSPSGNMNLVVSLACIKMKMTPEESINAATVNAAYALNEHGRTGSITRGKKADLIITEPIPSYTFLPYSFGENHIASVYLGGVKL